MSTRPRVEIAIDRRRPERVRVLLGPPEACVLVRTCTSSEEVFDYLWLVLRVPPELAAVKVADLKQDSGSIATQEQDGIGNLFFFHGNHVVHIFLN